MPRPPSALVFDFDGLILDTETPEVVAWQRTFREFGCEFPDDWWIAAIGRGADQIMETPLELLCRLAKVPVDEAAVSVSQKRLFEDLIAREDARPGVRSLIAEAKAEGMPIAVASSSRHAWVDSFLGRLGLFQEFDAVLCADDVERAKPFPDLYLAAVNAIDVSPAEAIALEDSPNGIKAAKAAGLHCVAVPNTLTGQLDLSHADRIVDSLHGLSLSHFALP